MAAVVAWWKVVGPGFGWLAGAVTVLLGGTGWAVGGGWAAGVGTLAAVAGFGLARRPQPAALAFGVAALLYAGASISDGGVFGTMSGAVLLGAITAEMLLGHWYLIDPSLPRWALKRLAVAGAAGVILDGSVVAIEAGVDWGGEVTGWVFLVLGITTFVLMVAVRFALNEPSYPGVMAATGLSYLAILTAIGSAVAGRAVLDNGASLLAGPSEALGTIAFL